MSFDPRLWHINQDLTPLNLTAFRPGYTPITRKEHRAAINTRRALAYLARQSQRNLRRRVGLSPSRLDVLIIQPALRAMGKLGTLGFGQPPASRKMACFPVYGIKPNVNPRVRYIWPGTQVES